MSDYLISFYKRGSTAPAHQILVNAVSSNGVIETAKNYLANKNVPKDELDGCSIISCNKIIDGIEVIT